MSLKFYTDTHIAKQVAVQFRAKGIEVVRCEDVGMAEADDEAHLEYASENGLALITKDDDFLTIHRQGKQHSGIFYCPYRNIPAIGLIVTKCSEYHDMIELGAATIEEIHNEIFYIT
jgi:predicted nuclease of predicted toxin-antitoxin system